MKATNETEIASSRSVEKDEIENNNELNFNGDFNRNLHGKFLSARTLKDLESCGFTYVMCVQTASSQ